jgi:hypothetical protein
MKSVQYIGLSCVGSRAEAVEFRAGVRRDRWVMIGTCIRGSVDEWNPDTWPHRCPKFDVLPTIFGPEKYTLNIVHVHPPKGAHLHSYLEKAHQLAGPYCHGIQVNAPWSNANPIAKYKREGSRDRIVTLSLQQDAFKKIGNSLTRLRTLLGDYDGIVDYVLVDTSAGAGAAFDPAFYDAVLSVIKGRLPKIGLVVAGGLSAENAEAQLKDIASAFTISTDMEGDPRTADDRLDVQKAVRNANVIDKILGGADAQFGLLSPIDTGQ